MSGRARFHNRLAATISVYENRRGPSFQRPLSVSRNSILAASMGYITAARNGLG
jgi:hypothetical protein